MVEKDIYYRAMRWGSDINNWDHLQRIYFWCEGHCQDWEVSTQAKDTDILVIFEFTHAQDACLFTMVWL